MAFLALNSGGAPQGSLPVARLNAQGNVQASVSPSWSSTVATQFTQLQGRPQGPALTTPTSQASTAAFGDQEQVAGSPDCASSGSAMSAAPSFGGVFDQTQDVNEEGFCKHDVSNESSWRNLQTADVFTSTAVPQYFSPRAVPYPTAVPYPKGMLTANGHIVSGTELLLRDEVQALRHEALTLRRDLADKQGRIAALELEAKSAREDAHTAREDAQARREEIQDLHRVLEQREKTITELAERFEKNASQMEADLKASAAQNESLQVELRAIRAVMLTAPNVMPQEKGAASSEESIAGKAKAKAKAKASSGRNFAAPTAATHNRNRGTSPSRDGSALVRGATARKAPTPTQRGYPNGRG
eukprot:gnl/MRDRNA2_/MRDRNA2_55833_c0_seq1.p1 gnl/MRDRNA2_/MRDRNA2_55833_c0~~gnl/MRDRNA2_/MRDRNA2_55833_c0_seq1.p1  ORF type:complete len:358 (+),score=86.12 gnl/MRDRNA2_/MRDRNA2_55833_c0_seq1:90-1163(+)